MGYTVVDIAEIRRIKTEIRKEIGQKRDSLSIDERDEKSKRIMEILFSLKEFKDAGVIHFFVNTRSEVFTDEMIRGALLIGKRVVAPLIDSANRRLLLSEIKDYDKDLIPGYWGILEPKRESFREVSIDDVHLMVMPGLAFDEKGGRIGYGGGYYDRLLSVRNRKMPLVAVSFDLQIVRNVPIHEKDVRVDKIVTESRVIDCSKNRQGRG